MQNTRWTEETWRYAVWKFGMIYYRVVLTDNKIKMRGLGTRLEPDGYQTWLCLLDHPCGDPSYCWVYHERDQVFTPWGKNSELKLFKT